MEEVLDLLGLDGLQNELVAKLPIGTCRLVELARAMCTGAQLILMDEPCSGLDRRETAALEIALRQVQSQVGLALLVVEHDMEFILSLATWLYVMNFGQVIAAGSPDEIRKSEQVRLAYLGAVRGRSDAKEHE
jgi:branched-chain amino acid transport system ATP-binding protein